MNDRLLDLATAVSDGQEVDWSDESARGENSQVLRELEFVASVLSAHQTLHASESLDDEVAAPQVWSGLEIRGEFGRGSMGVVYRAYDARLQREVALKLRAPAASADEDRLEVALEEGRMLARVRHPHVVTVFGAEFADERLGIWMEAIDGVTLARLLHEKGRLGPREVGAIGLDLCGALAAVHAAGLVHGDIKAQNVMREEGGRIVLMDFGAGSVSDPRGDAAEPPRRGTPLYLAPELLDGTPASPASDLYAHGVLLFQLLTGRFPVEAATLEELRLRHRDGSRLSLRDLRPELRQAWHEFFEQALAPNPGERFATAGAMGDALSSLAGGEPAPPRKRWPAGLLVAAAVAALALLLWGRTPTAPDPIRLPDIVHDSELTASLWGAGLAVDRPLVSGDVVKPGDHLYLKLRSEQPIHVYVVNLDARGRVHVLFPLPEAQYQNPLPAEVELRLPGEADWQFDSWQVDTVGEEEAVLVIASRGPLDRLETALATIPTATPEGGAPLDRPIVDAMRGMGRLSTSPKPVSGEDAEILAEALRQLSSLPVEEHRLSVREVRLRNPD